MAEKKKKDTESKSLPKAKPSTSLVPKSASPVVRYDPKQAYLADIRRYPLLTPEEEYDLAVKYREESDLAAAHQLVTSNLRLVVKIAMDYQKYWMNLLDLVQEGNVGLMQAVKNYDPYRGVKLSSYASFWIKAYILKFIIDNWSLVKIGTTQAQRKLFFNLKKEKERYALLGYDASAEEIADNLDVKTEQVVEMQQRMAGGDLSLNQPVGDESEQTHIDLLADKQVAFDDKIADDEVMQLFREKMAEIRENLSEKELYVLEHRLLSDEPETLHEIGERYGVSRERIRQIEARFIDKLRAYFDTELPELFDLEVSREE